MITYSPDYLYAFETNHIDNAQLMKRCFNIERKLTHTLPPVEKSWFGNKPSAWNMEYNLFTFPVPELYELYETMQEKISPLLDYNRSYALKSWMNIFRKGENVNPHHHFEPEFDAWHGFYCVNVGKNASYTTYKIPDVEKEIVVPSKNGLLVIGRSRDDRHWSSVWEDDTQPRITLAFDICPIDTLIPEEENGSFRNCKMNFFLPFKHSKR